MPCRRVSRSIPIGKLLFISAGSLCHRKLLSSFIFKSRGHPKTFLHILFVCSILNWPLQIHVQQQASLAALKSEAVAEVDKMQTMTQQMVAQ
jgi:hypothetical protein